MEGRATYKVPDGKLLRARVTFDSKINTVVLTGDFFAYPDEGVKAIESALKGTDVGFSESDLAKLLSDLIKRDNIGLIGIDGKAIAHVIKEAMAL